MGHNLHKNIHGISGRRYIHRLSVSDRVLPCCLLTTHLLQTQTTVQTEPGKKGKNKTHLHSNRLYHDCESTTRFSSSTSLRLSILWSNGKKCQNPGRAESRAHEQATGLNTLKPRCWPWNNEDKGWLLGGKHPKSSLVPWCPLKINAVFCHNKSEFSCSRYRTSLQFSKINKKVKKYIHLKNGRGDRRKKGKKHLFFLRRRKTLFRSVEYLDAQNYQPHWKAYHYLVRVPH